MSELESLVLAGSNIVEDYIATFSDIIDCLGITKFSLLLAYQVQFFIKGIIDPYILP